MTVVPLPDKPCVRVRLVYNEGTIGESGNRLYFAYSGSAPTGANCATLAADIASAWNTNLASQVGSNVALNEVDVLDIATNSGLSGQWTGTHAGTRTGTDLPFSVCTNIEFGIARRYRGGKPRVYFPPGIEGDLQNQVSWNTSYTSGLQTDFAAFISAIEALSIGAIGTLTHVNLSYYHGFTNVMNTSGRERAVPTYRATALSDTVTGYFVKTIIGSQRRRRTSTTP